MGDIGAVTERDVQFPAKSHVLHVVGQQLSNRQKKKKKNEMQWPFTVEQLVHHVRPLLTSFHFYLQRSFTLQLFQY